MNMMFDAGEIYAQGPVADIDPSTDSHVYIGHKAILDSLPDTVRLLESLERGTARPLTRPGAADHLYTYPTASALARIVARAWQRRITRALRRR